MGHLRLARGVGTPLDEERFAEKHWHRALRATGTRPRKFYATRHTFITAAVSKPGINLKWLADYCGTSVEMIEDHYAGSLNQAAQVAQIALLSGGSGTVRRGGGGSVTRGRLLDAKRVRKWPLVAS